MKKLLLAIGILAIAAPTAAIAETSIIPPEREPAASEEQAYAYDADDDQVNCSLQRIITCARASAFTDIHCYEGGCEGTIQLETSAYAVGPNSTATPFSYTVTKIGGGCDGCVETVEDEVLCEQDAVQGLTESCVFELSLQLPRHLASTGGCVGYKVEAAITTINDSSFGETRADASVELQLSIGNCVSV
ncbi:MAG: hypothetical protein ACLGH3_05490 [Actinomycetota bacterium]